MVSFKQLLLCTSLLASASAATLPTLLAKRVLNQGGNANQVCETDYVTAMQISDNGGSATVVDLSGCTAVFFFMGTTLRRAVHISCGQERTDAEAAAKDAVASDYAVIAVSSQHTDYYDNAKAGILAARQIAVRPMITYDPNSAPAGEAVTFTAKTGSIDVTQGTAAKVCQEQ